MFSRAYGIESRNRGSSWTVSVLGSAFLAALLTLNPVIAQEHKHSLRLEYQFLHGGEIDTTVGPFTAATDTHVVLLSGTYSLGGRWKIFGSIPYVRKRYLVAGPNDLNVHNPNVDFVNYTPPDLRFVDDGKYHSGFQDVSVGVQYRAIDGPVSVSPYISLGVPVSDYPVYGNAVIGRHLWEMPIGIALQYTPYFSDWHFQADVSYVISEEALGIHLDYWLWHAAASYYVTPRFVPRIFLVQRHAPNSLNWPEDFPDDFDNEIWFHHDRILEHGYLNGGIGFDYIVNDRYSISATYYKTLDPEHVVELDKAYMLALTRRF